MGLATTTSTASREPQRSLETAMTRESVESSGDSESLTSLQIWHRHRSDFQKGSLGVSDDGRLVPQPKFLPLEGQQLLFCAGALPSAQESPPI